jgi:hypothetical protein
MKLKENDPILRELERNFYEECQLCAGKGCETCFLTGKKLVSTNELFDLTKEKIGCSRRTFNTNLLSLERAKWIKKFVRYKAHWHDPSRKYLWLYIEIEDN